MDDDVRYFSTRQEDMLAPWILRNVDVPDDIMDEAYELDTLHIRFHKLPPKNYDDWETYSDALGTEDPPDGFCWYRDDEDEEDSDGIEFEEA